MNTTTIAPDSVPCLAPGLRLQWEKAQDCHVLLFPEGMVQLSDSAHLILEQCTGEQTTQQIVCHLSAQFPDADLTGDVYDFLEQALSHVWIKIK